tara:strand:+ start:631 stop:969 length:339 start_codon:yes stop_codon:yes gene_type:complete
MNNKDIHLDLLRKLELNPKLTQRELSQEMGVSLGKVNYCMKKLFSKGLIKLNNFGSNPNKVRYVYILTPRGLEEKAKLTIKFLKIKMEEYELLKDEIELLQKDSKKIKFKRK